MSPKASKQTEKATEEQQEETPQEEVQEEVKQQETPLEETPSQESEEVSQESAESEESAAAEESGESAEELRAQLAEKEAELATLKGSQPSAQPAQPTQRQSYESYFVQNVRPESERVYAEINPVRVKDDGTVAVDPDAQKKQFGVISGMAEKMMLAVLGDRVNPIMAELASSNISLQNEIDLLRLQMKDPTSARHEPLIRKGLASLSWQDRGKEGAVLDVYHKIIGSQRRVNGQGAHQPRPATASALRDLTAGGTTVARKPIPVRLTSEQEADFLEMKEGDANLTRERYAATLKSRNEIRKRNNRPLLKVLRSY